MLQQPKSACSHIKNDDFTKQRWGCETALPIIDVNLSASSIGSTVQELQEQEHILEGIDQHLGHVLRLLCVQEVEDVGCHAQTASQLINELGKDRTSAILSFKTPAKLLHNYCKIIALSHYRFAPK